MTVGQCQSALSGCYPVSLGSAALWKFLFDPTPVLERLTTHTSHRFIARYPRVHLGCGQEGRSAMPMT